MHVKVYRCDPGAADTQERYDSYELPMTLETKPTVMDVLDYISANHDGSLAYYKHSVCDHGICGRCGLLVNGKPALACTRTVVENDLTLEPLRKKKLVRDLVTI